MDRLFLFIFPLALLAARCSSEKQPDEAIICIGSLGNNHKVEIHKDEYLLIPKFNLFLVHYHDSVFKLEVDTTGKQTCYLVRYKPIHQRIADSLFRALGRKDQQIPLSEYDNSCAPELVCLYESKRQVSFSKVSYNTFSAIYKYGIKSKKAFPITKLPADVEAKLFEMEARYMRHYFSDRYYYKQLRTERVQRFLYLFRLSA
jgi:hypothetical protein